MPNEKIFIDQESKTGDFLMRMPAEALPDFYEMLCEAPLLSRRWFYQVKEHLESNYAQDILHKPRKEADHAVL